MKSADNLFDKHRDLSIGLAIYAWRHDLKKKGLWSPDAGALFYPVDIPITAVRCLSNKLSADFMRRL